MPLRRYTSFSTISNLPRVIKYIWSATLPIGTRFTNPLYGRGRVNVLRSGHFKIGEWFREITSFYEDYKNLFGEEPGKVQGIGILFSSDLTKASPSPITTTSFCFLEPGFRNSK